MLAMKSDVKHSSGGDNPDPIYWAEWALSQTIWIGEGTGRNRGKWKGLWQGKKEKKRTTEGIDQEKGEERKGKETKEHGRGERDERIRPE